MKILLHLFLVLLPVTACSQRNAPAMQDYTQPYTRSSLIADVMADPAFGDFGHLLLPVNTSYWSGTTLEDLRLTWYNGIDPDKTVEIVNYLKDHAVAGEQVFFRIYTEAEMLADPEKRDVGLFFFRAQNTQERKPFAICNAGGGHVYVGAMHDSYPHALEIAKKGYNAFALIYRPDWDTSDEDLARAITFVCDHADALGVQATDYSLWGGSAGARMAADFSQLSHLRSSTGRNDIPQAAACIMQYTGYSTVATDYAPTYANCGKNDGIASWQGMQNRLNQLSAYGIPTEFHAYDGLPHGFGLGTGTVAQGWTNDAIRFWEALMSGTTGIENVHSAAFDGKRYNLQGQQVGEDYRGIVIQNGQKQVIQ